MLEKRQKKNKQKQKQTKHPRNHDPEDPITSPEHARAMAKLQNEFSDEAEEATPKVKELNCIFRMASRRKVAFLSALVVNFIITLSQQQFMFQLFVKENPTTQHQTLNIVLMAVQHVVVMIITFLVVAFLQAETFWSVKNVRQTITFYLMHILLALTVPWFTLGEHVSSMTRQCFIVGVSQIVYTCTFPPPLMHALISMYIMPCYFLYRTHAFNMLSNEAQKLVQHTAAECTICAFKCFTLVSVMMYYRVVPVAMVEGMPFDNESRENLLVISKKMGRLEAENDYKNALMFGGQSAQIIIGQNLEHSVSSSDNLDLDEIFKEGRSEINTTNKKTDLRSIKDKTVINMTGQMPQRLLNLTVDDSLNDNKFQQSIAYQVFCNTETALGIFNQAGLTNLMAMKANHQMVISDNILNDMDILVDNKTMAQVLTVRNPKFEIMFCAGSENNLYSSLNVKMFEVYMFKQLQGAEWDVIDSAESQFTTLQMADSAPTQQQPGKLSLLDILMSLNKQGMLKKDERHVLYLHTSRLSTQEEKGKNKRKVKPQMVTLEMEITVLDQLAKNVLVAVKSIDAVKEIFLNSMRLKFQQQLSQSLAHEKMTPLNGIISLSSMIEVQLAGVLKTKSRTCPQNKQDSKSGKQSISKENLKWISDCATVIWSNSKMLEFMTISQLDYLKLNNRSFYHYKESDKPLKEELNEFLLCFRKIISDRGLEFRVQLIDKMPDATTFCCDWRVYKSVLYHILSNAVKFCNSKGKMGLTITYQEFQSLNPDHAGLKTGYLCSEILNTGEGMDRKQLKKLGKSFLKEKGNQVTQGVGLGLVTAKELCQSLEGDLKISSSKEHGTVVTFMVMVSDKPFKKTVNDQSKTATDENQKKKNKKQMDNSCVSLTQDLEDEEELDPRKNKLLVEQMVNRALRPRYYHDLDHETCKLLVNQYLKDGDNSFYRTRKNECNDSVIVNQAKDAMMKNGQFVDNSESKVDQLKRNRSNISVNSALSLSEEISIDEQVLAKAQSQFFEIKLASRGKDKIDEESSDDREEKMDMPLCQSEHRNSSQNSSRSHQSSPNAQLIKLLLHKQLVKRESSRIINLLPKEDNEPPPVVEQKKKVEKEGSKRELISKSHQPRGSIKILCNCPQIVVLNAGELANYPLKTVLKSLFDVSCVDLVKSTTEVCELFEAQGSRQCCTRVYKLLMLDTATPDFDQLVAKVTQIQNEHKVKHAAVVALCSPTEFGQNGKPATQRELEEKALELKVSKVMFKPIPIEQLGGLMQMFLKLE